MTIIEISTIAERHGWKLVAIQLDIGLCSFTKQLKGEFAKVNVYRTTMTVATCLNHPKQGKTQLFRKKVSEKLLEQIFENPRIHTNKGYKIK